MIQKSALRFPSCCTQTHLEKDVAKQIGAILQPPLQTRRKLLCCVNTNIRGGGGQTYRPLERYMKIFRSPGAVGADWISQVCRK
jgi:hypothetical protein